MLITSFLNLRAVWIERIYGKWQFFNQMIIIVARVLSGTSKRYGAATSRVFAIYENFQVFFRFRSSSL